MNLDRFHLNGRGKMLLTSAVALALLVLIGYVVVEYGVNRVYVPEGSSLLLRYKGPPLPFLPGGRPPAAPGEFAQVDEDGEPTQLGIVEEMTGPGRHFYSPLWWETKLVPDVNVTPGHVALVTSRMGENLPEGQYLVDGDLGETQHKGILRNVLGPGRYRINPYAYEHKIESVVTIGSNGQTKHAGWIDIPTGYVGVVTNLTGNPLTGAEPGIQEHVLQPGLYPINPKEQHVDIIGVGLWENTVFAELEHDANGFVVYDE
ncbi:MAG: SPFH domain-containing protein, partial [Planctomycetaceae bacterium]